MGGEHSRIIFGIITNKYWVLQKASADFEKKDFEARTANSTFWIVSIQLLSLIRLTESNDFFWIRVKLDQFLILTSSAV